MIDLEEIREWLEKNDVWNNIRYKLSDTGAGYLFADWAKNKARYMYSRRRWYVYNGIVWEPDAGGKVAVLCKRLALGLWSSAVGQSAEIQKYALKWQQQKQQEIILRSAMSVYPIEIDDFDKDPMLYNCLNCTIDLRTMKTHKHTPEDMLTLVSGVKYDPKAECPRWSQFVMEVLQDDLTKALYMQTVFGYGLTGLAKENCLYQLHGATGRNGKGTMLETYMTMQGGYAKAARPETIARGRRNSAGPSEDLARLAGARVVNISELPQGLQMDSALVKTLTGGDTVTARFLNEGSFEFRPQFKIFINTNYKLRIDDPIVFSSGRMKLISFNRHFSEEEQDKDLKEKLSQPQELSGILNWCLSGLKDYLSNGIREPQCVKDDTEAYRQDSDTVCQFIEATMDVNPNGEILTTKAYAAYMNWCGSMGALYRDYQSFRETVEAQFMVRKKRPKGSPRTVAPQSFICGVCWREGLVIGATGVMAGGEINDSMV